MSDSGGLTIDCTEAPGLLRSSDGAEMMSALFVSDIGDSSVTIDDAGQPAAVASYLGAFLEERGYSVILDPRLHTLLETSIRHTADIAELRSGGRKRFQLGDETRIGLVRPLLAHQSAAVEHAVTVGNAANFSVPGSGKTAVALATFAAMLIAKRVKRMLVIGPASSFAPWEEEFQLTFGRAPRVLRVTGSHAKRVESLRHLETTDLVLCTYQMAHRERESLVSALQVERYLVVLDESHHIKNIELGPWASAAIELAPFAEARMILTGTPAPYSLLDLWSQFTFLWPSQALLGTRSEFESRIDEEDSAAAAIASKLRPFFFRTKKSDLGLSHPEYLFEILPNSAVPRKQRAIIKVLELKTLSDVRALGLGTGDMSLMRRWRRSRTIRLMQAASNPGLLVTASGELGDPADPADDSFLASIVGSYSSAEVPAKVAWTLQKVRALVGQRKKVIVWAHFVDNLLLLRNLLKDLAPLLAYGGIPAFSDALDPEFETRERNISDFKHDPDRLVLLANPAACAESVSLHTVCHDAVYLERTFNCAQFLQSLDRIHRVGMPEGTHPTYYIPIVPCSIERVLDRRLRERQETLYRILEDDMPVLGLDDEDAVFDDEDDLDAVFADLLGEIEASANEDAASADKRS